MLIALRGEDEIRTRGTRETYVGLANRWFQPLTHLSRGTVPMVLSNLAFGPDCKDTKINYFAIGPEEKDYTPTRYLLPGRRETSFTATALQM